MPACARASPLAGLPLMKWTRRRSAPSCRASTPIGRASSERRAGRSWKLRWGSWANSSRCHGHNNSAVMPPTEHLVHRPDDHARLLAGEPVIDDLAVAARGDEAVGAQPRELL